MSNPASGLAPCELIDHAIALIEKRRRRNESSSVLLLAHGDAAEVRRTQERLTAAGARVVVAYPQPPEPDRLAETLTLEQAISDRTGPQGGQAAELPPLPGEPYDMVLALRALSHLPYEQARTALRRLLFRLRIGGKLYLALYGIHSDLGDDYPDGGQLVHQRHCPLAPGVAARYGIDGPVCLYSERNIFSLLLEAGAAVIHTSTSALGHVRGIANRV